MHPCIHAPMHSFLFNLFQLFTTIYEVPDLLQKILHFDFSCFLWILFFQYIIIIFFPKNYGKRKEIMYLVEKISNLILITLEDNITEAEIEEVKIKLTKIAEMAKDDVVVSINLSEKAKQKEAMQFTLENKINELLKFCYLSGLRVYSYRCT
jgi:hypothetical protein